MGMAAWLEIAQCGAGQALKNDIIRQPGEAGGLFVGAICRLLPVVLGAGMVATLAIPRLPWARILNSPGFHQTGLLVALVWIALATALLSLVRATYGAFQAEYVLAPAMLAGVTASLVLVFLATELDWGMPAAVEALLAANAIGLLCGLCRMCRQLNLRFAAPVAGGGTGLWFFAVEICTILIFEADLFLVNLLAGPAAAAAFALHLQLFAYVEAGLALVVTPWWSAVGEAAHAGEKAWLRVTIGRLGAATALLSLGGVGLVLSIGRPVMQLWTHGRIAWDPVLAAVVGAKVMVQGITGVYANSLGALGVVREPLPVVLLQGVLNVGACFWMVRRLGAVGGALASLITFSLTSALYLPWKTRAVLS